MKDNWFSSHIRQVHVDFHMPEFPYDAIKDFNAETFVAEFVRAKVNVIGIFTKCHFGNAFYDNQVGHKHRGLAQDFFGEVLEEAHKHNIKVIAYYSLGTDAYAVEHNPDWYQIDKDGNKRGGKGTVWELPCINSPYREELVIPQLKEITEKYPMDGYLIDIPYLWDHHCFCRYCQKKFSEEYSMELTPELLASNPKLVNGFAKQSAARCMQEIYDVVKAIRPEVLVNCNGAWKMGEPAEINATSDYGLWESQPASGTFLCHSIRARFVRSLPVPVQIMTVRFTEGWGLMSCKTAEQLKYEFATIMANGGVINIGDQVLPSGKLQSGVYDIIGDAFSFIEEREQLCIGSTATKHIALIGSYTENWYFEQGDSATLGAAKMLIEGHHQFDIFFNDDFPNLSAYKVVVLPETVRLNQQSTERLAEFVRRGGLLLAAGEASLNQGGGGGRTNFLLAEVLGVDYLDRTPYPFAYMTENTELWEGTAAIPQLVEGPFLKVKSSTSEALSYIQWPLTVPAPQRAFRHPIPPAGRISDFPAITANRFGLGDALYISGPIFSTYWDNNHFWLRRIVNNLLNKYDRDRPFTVEAPPTVEANLMEKDGVRYLHLINFHNGHSGSRKQSFYDPIESITPVHDVKVMFHDTAIKEVIQWPEGAVLDLSLDSKGNGIQIIVPKLHIHSVLEMRY
ncbi:MULTISPECIES: family 10 glycosylhydrolase [unclassified Paenibacillus]|uniref:family 10 glycosylhydrolase n=1 Tax=unclassified Paenibacillus TaxID=185978 RepID=UPI0036332603